MRILKAVINYFVPLFVVFGEATKRLFLENFSTQASALTFNTILSLVMVTSFSLYILSYLPAFQHLGLVAQEYIYLNFVPETGVVVHRYILQFTQQATKLPLGSIIFTFFSGILFCISIIETMDIVWHIKHQTRNLKLFILKCIFLFMLPIFIGLSLTVSHLILSAALSDNFFILYTVHAIINIITFSALYIITANIHLSWHDAIFGGLIVEVFFEFSKLMFVYYIQYLANYKLIYGALAIIPSFLIWLYIFWMIIIFGALAIENKRRKDLEAV